jgi:hypothetical protein
VVQVVEHLPSKSKALCSTLQYPKIKQSIHNQQIKPSKWVSARYNPIWILEDP